MLMLKHQHEIYGSNFLDICHVYLTGADHFTLGFLYMARNKTDTNSELFKESHEAAMYKNSCRS